ncbi:hypothetical protein GNZ12_30530 [Paraburkholderia sp. 1N]|uniref:Uncharacterized protein n=1 Tax=Paraburkholderia solitsugae TaxID=2675748 RepID=A0ABX2C123_9BURK|nr:hypothetical protein [Paraburkholderia solitsugae]NPT45582.1 hypothetical protein [Paraburkholderia solitsugae]
MKNHPGSPVTDSYCDNASAIVMGTVVQSKSARGALREHGAALRRSRRERCAAAVCDIRDAGR